MKGSRRGDRQPPQPRQPVHTSRAGGAGMRGFLPARAQKSARHPQAAHQAGQKIKVIFENCYLKDPHKIELCRICSELNVDWVKTSTGYGPSGATIEDLKLMRAHVSPEVEVKAAGGVRDLATLLAVRDLGVSRCGSSRTRELLDPARATLGLEPIVILNATSVNNQNY